MKPVSLFRLTSLLAIGALAYSQALASGAGNSPGLILFDPGSARAAAVGEAFSAVPDDISAFAYNPASLRTLTSSQLSVMYQRGITDDSRGRFLMGKPIDCGGIGMNINYYDGGGVDVNDGLTKRSADAKKDFVFTLGAARSIGNVAVGIAGKYISSEIIEQENAAAWAADFGAQVSLHPRWTLGAALQNVGTNLKYVNKRERLPRIGRLGATWQALQGPLPLLILAEVPFFFNEEEIRPAAGAETQVGPMAFRVGYKSRNELANFSFGAGFAIRQFSIDYSYGLVSEINDEHNVSFNVKFGKGS